MGKKYHKPLFIQVRDQNDWSIKVMLERTIPNATFDIWHEEPDPEVLATPIMRLGGQNLYFTEKALKELEP